MVGQFYRDQVLSPGLIHWDGSKFTDLTPTDLPANFQTCSGWGTSDGGTVFIGGGTGDAQNNNNLGYMYRWDRG